jgi:hypothetical protein
MRPARRGWHVPGRRGISWVLRWLVLAAILAPPLTSGAEEIDPRRFEVFERDSGPTSYYKVVNEDGRSFIRAMYRPPLETVILAVELEGEERRARRLRWRWRALALPVGGNTCVSGKSDSAAAVYVTWKRGRRYYILRHVWTAGAETGTRCRRKSNFVSVNEVVVRASGGPLAVWRDEEIDLAQAFKDHFGGAPGELVGIGVMTDGDQTGSVSAADYGGFTVLR